MKNPSSPISIALIGTALLATFAGIVIAVSDVASWLPIFLMVIAILFTVMPISFGLAFHRNRFDIFAPVYVLNITILLHFIFPALDYLSPERGYSVDLLSKGIATVITFMILFYIGYFIPLSRSKQTAQTVVSRNPNVASYNDRVLIVGIILLTLISIYAEWHMLNAIGGFSTLMSLMRSRLAMFDYISGVTLTMIRLVRPAFFSTILLVFHYSDKSPFRYKALAIVTGILAVSIGFFTGNRGDFISPILTVMIFYHYRKRRIPVTYALAFLVVAIIFLSLYLVFVRNPNMQGEMMGMTLTQKIGYLMDDSFGEGTFMEIRSVMDVIRGVPNILPYQWGKTYFALATSLIPRSIFPNKLPEAATVFNLAFYPERWLAGGGGARVSMIGELFMNFGLAGVLIGGAVLGWIMRKIYTIFPSHQDPLKIMFYAITLPAFYFMVRGNFVGVTVRFIFDWLPVWAIVLIAAHFGTITESRRSIKFAKRSV